jgi:hypothetical protein
LFEFLKRRRYRERFRAALAVYVAAYTYELLTASDKACVREWIREFAEWRGTWSGITFFEFDMFLDARAKAAFWAVAMNDLGIPPSIPGEHWDIPSTPGWWSRHREVDRLLLHFRPYNATTTEVENYLLSKGIDVGAIDLLERNRRVRQR